MKQWYCNIQGQQYGPVAEEVLRSWIAQRRVTSGDLVWSEGMPDWVTAQSVFSDAFAAATALIAAPPPVVPGLAKPPKSRLAAGLLGILIGSLGIHNFYLGYTGKGLAQLLITLLTCGFGAFISYVWGLIEGIMILTGSINCDAEGRPLGQ